MEFQKISSFLSITSCIFSQSINKKFQISFGLNSAYFFDSTPFLYDPLFNTQAQKFNSSKLSVGYVLNKRHGIEFSYSSTVLYFYKGNCPTCNKIGNKLERNLNSFSLNLFKTFQRKNTNYYLNLGLTFRSGLESDLLYIYNGISLNSYQNNLKDFGFKPGIIIEKPIYEYFSLIAYSDLYYFFYRQSNEKTISTTYNFLSGSSKINLFIGLGVSLKL